MDNSYQIKHNLKGNDDFSLCHQIKEKKNKHLSSLDCLRLIGCFCRMAHLIYWARLIYCCIMSICTLLCESIDFFVLVNVSKQKEVVGRKTAREYSFHLARLCAYGRQYNEIYHLPLV